MGIRDVFQMPPSLFPRRRICANGPVLAHRMRACRVQFSPEFVSNLLSERENISQFIVSSRIRSGPDRICPCCNAQEIEVTALSREVSMSPRR